VTRPKPITIQRSGAIIIDSQSDPDGVLEDVLRQYAELKSAAGHMHTYQVTEVALWGAAASGNLAQPFLDLLNRYSETPPPVLLVRKVQEFFNRYGKLWLEYLDGQIILRSTDAVLLSSAARQIDSEVTDGYVSIDRYPRAKVKAELAQSGMPVIDRTVRAESGTVDVQLSDSVHLRDYQRQARDRFITHAHAGGVIILPCGAGKTVVGVAIAARLQSSTLVVTPNRTIGEQWASHFCSMTSLSADDIDLFPSEISSRPVSIVTYQSLTSQKDGFANRLADAQEIPWGLVIYDEVHSLPADVFRQSAALQSTRRLGLTATLVREDGREREVYALVGPPVWQSRWRELEREGWISPVECFEVRVRVDSSDSSGDRGFAGKVRTVERLLDRHTDDQILIAARRLRDVEILSNRFGVPSIVGKTPQARRRELFDAFRNGQLNRLVVSSVANVGVDLPDANVLIQVSGTFGSRLEEAQRLGRLLRPKDSDQPARFYSLVLPVTREREFAERRQRFLIDQGYHYRIVNVRG
jgi:DNA excision repair protein ERCC-3